MNIVFKTERVMVNGKLNDSQTARKISQKMPLESSVTLWGDEIYFEIPVVCVPENLTMDVSIGDIAYWPSGHCLCVFFGPTPASGEDGFPAPASAVTVVGRIDGDISLLTKIRPGERIEVKVLND